MNDDLKYLQSLKVGDRVIETGHSCMFGAMGIVYMSDTPGHGPCVMWDLPEGKMGTSVTHSTRRIKDVLLDYEATQKVLHAALALQETADKMAYAIKNAIHHKEIDERRNEIAEAYIQYEGKKKRLAKESKT